MNIGVNLVSGDINTYAKYLPSGAWLRLMLWWDKCQPKKGGAITLPDWSGLDSFPKLLQLRCSPDWSRYNKGKICKLPHNFWSAFVKYADYAIAVVQPEIVELGNEPDVDPAKVSIDLAPFVGCQGKSVAAGIRYAIFCKYVAGKLRVIHPEVKIAVGALMYKKSWKFITGLRGGWAPHKFDYISYHQYAYNVGDLTRVLRKGQKLGNLFRKNVLLTETSVLSDVGGALHEDRKADYLRRLRNSIHSSIIERAWWHTLHGGWRNNGLMEDVKYCPAYEEWKRGFIA